MTRLSAGEYDAEKLMKGSFPISAARMVRRRASRWSAGSSTKRSLFNQRPEFQLMERVIWPDEGNVHLFLHENLKQFR